MTVCRRVSRRQNGVSMVKTKNNEGPSKAVEGEREREGSLVRCQFQEF